jgi:hypothetical protein
VNGLTVYISGNGIVGMEIHFTKVSRLIGDRDSRPKHFPFDSGAIIYLLNNYRLIYESLMPSLGQSLSFAT